MATKTKNIRELAKGKGKRDLWYLDPRIIQMKEGWNERDERPDLAEHIQGIADSIFATGYDAAEPIIIYPDGGQYFVSDGHCRLRGTLLAIKMGADVEAIPVITEANGVNEADRVAGMITRNSGLPLTQLEIGRVCVRLAGFGWSQKRIADKIGKKLPYVAGIFTLMEATPGTHAHVINGEVSPTVVAASVREHGPAKAEKFIDRAIRQSGGKRATARAVAAASSGEPRTHERTLSQVEEFFASCIREQDVPPGVIRMAEAFMAFRLGKSTPEQFADRLGELCGEMVEA